MLFDETFYRLSVAYGKSPVQRHFCFIVLPFGLSSAPFLFTKMFRPQVRFHGVWPTELDVKKDFSITQCCSDIAPSDLVSARLVTNCAKSVWFPVQPLGDFMGPF